MVLKPLQSTTTLYIAPAAAEATAEYEPALWSMVSFPPLASAKVPDPS